MATTVFNYGLDVMNDWTTGTFKFLLLKGSGYTPNKDHQFVSSVTPASNEVSGAGYSRQSVSGPSRTVDTSNDRITYDCSDPSFGSIVVGETVTGLVLFKYVSSDANSILIAHYPLGSIPTTGASFSVTISPNGVLYVAQG